MRLNWYVGNFAGICIEFDAIFSIFPLFFKQHHRQIATDPKLALQKIRELWTYLSLDEPENQARPQTIEELIVLLTRESARRLVHLVNFTRNTATKVPKYGRRSES